MKTQLLSPLALCLAALLVSGSPALRAQDAEKAPEKPATEEPKPEPEQDPAKKPIPETDATEEDAEGEPEEAQPTPEELEEQMKEAEKEEKAVVDRMMKVFTPLEGAWTGKESLKYNDERFRDKSWKDEWSGKFTFGGRYFEMDGQTEGDNQSAYRWVCTFDISVQRYRAWYFGDNAQNQYLGTLSADGSHVIWRTRSRETGSESEFTMKAEGNRVKCEGKDKLAGGKLFSTQSSEYTRKRVEL